FRLGESRQRTLQFGCALPQGYRQQEHRWRSGRRRQDRQGLRILPCDVLVSQPKQRPLGFGSAQGVGRTRPAAPLRVNLREGSSSSIRAGQLSIQAEWTKPDVIGKNANSRHGGAAGPTTI